MWTVDRDSFFIGGAVFGFAATLIGFILSFPNQISFLCSIILSSDFLLLILILLNKKEKKEEKYGIR